MKVIEENQETITAYFTADELIDGDEVCGMVFAEGVLLYLVQRRKGGDGKSMTLESASA